MIKEVVGENVYNAWTGMLSVLVPQGRTHRLSVVIAGMLKYSSKIAYEKCDANPQAAELSKIFNSGYDNYVNGDIKEILAITEGLLEDAGIEYHRFNSRGVEYSIAEEAVREFLHWEDMPWES
ncbi:MAG: hypothetical protein ACE5GL_06380 [Calditrichia bacterium]